MTQRAYYWYTVHDTLPCKLEPTVAAWLGLGAFISTTTIATPAPFYRPHPPYVLAPHLTTCYTSIIPSKPASQTGSMPVTCFTHLADKPAPCLPLASPTWLTNRQHACHCFTHLADKPAACLPLLHPPR